MNEEQPSFPPVFYGLPNAAARAYFVCQHFLTQGKNVVWVRKSEEDSAAFEAAAHTFAPQNARIISMPEATAGRMAALYRLTQKGGPFLISLSAQDLSALYPDEQEFQRRLLCLERGGTLRRQDLLDALENAGYQREDYTEAPGQYAVRGSVVDIFCPDKERPLRLYFSGHKIESMAEFDLDTQNTREGTARAVIIPLRFEHLTAPLQPYTPQAVYVFEEPERETDFAPYPQAAVVSSLPSAGATDCGLQAGLRFGADWKLLEREAQNLQRRGLRLTVCCLNRGELDRLSEIFRDYPTLSKTPLQISPLTQGFTCPAEKFALITSCEILDRRYDAAAVIKHFDVEGAKRVRFKELAPGDYVVHQNHGIGKYLGLELMDKDENPTDCLIIEYRRGSKLYVPMYDFKKVQKYIGAGGKIPALSALGGLAWREVKQRVKEDAQKTAKEILQLEARRQATQAPLTPGDPRIEQEFADSFPYTLTPGQSQAIEEVLRDLTLSKPMDRVLVGDVGFGKTEVAMRAALRVALSGKQTMVLVPTTILADQHYKTFSKRMAGFPVTVRMLCRFQSPKEQKQVVQEIKNGVCDIIIGTHRLMSKDISFKDLGLVIIDEEHRFGVKQKEKIKAKSAGVHTLMLSATPIPRTLNQSLSSLRDISLIDTPPRGRTPIKTVVTAWNNELASAAITQELARGGQVYYVYNSVQSMQSRYLFLKKLVPQARICMAHGQMDEKELEQTLWDFNNGKYDILLASTIIESGIDITNANTLIVENAQNFGLAQLYQLRGRIGRGSAKAYCYLFHPDWLFKKAAPAEETSFNQLAAVAWKPKQEKDPTEEAKKRLAALMEFGELGSGFKLALRDMEIRGAGELLGVKQHGYVNEVGLSLYCDLVANEVKKLKGLPVKRELRATVNLPLAAFIPPDYLPDDAERLKYYKELMGADEAKTQQILVRLADLCGPVPQEIKNLTRVFALSAQAGALQIQHIESAPGRLEFSFSRDFQMPPDFPARLFAQYGAEHIEFLKSNSGDGIRLLLSDTQDMPAAAEQALAFFKAVFAHTKMV